MKVLFATYPMAFHTPGGGEVQLLAYANALKNRGILVELMDMWNPNFKRYDLIHYFSCVGGSHNFCNFIKSLNIPLVVSSSLWITPGTEGSYPMSDITCQLEGADKIVTNSMLESNLLSTVLKINIEKFKHVHNGYDKSILNFCNQKVIKNKGMILNVGNIEVRKNQLCLARALKNIPGASLHLVGGIRDKNYFDAIMNELPDRVIYHGVIESNSKKLIDLYRQCEVFVLPSMLETPGLAAIEAFVAGANVVITREGSANEYFHDDVTYIDPNNEYSIAEGIDLALRLDESIATSRQEFRNKFEWGAVIENLLITYEEAINDIH